MTAVLSFADTSDLQDGWRQLSANESRIANVLLRRASAIIIRELVHACIDIDKMDDVALQNAKTVACDMVRNSMVNAQNTINSMFGDVADAAIWEEQTEAIGGSLYLTKEQRRQLGISDQTIGSIGYVHKTCRF